MSLCKQRWCGGILTEGAVKQLENWPLTLKTTSVFSSTLTYLLKILFVSRFRESSYRCIYSQQNFEKAKFKVSQPLFKHFPHLAILQVFCDTTLKRVNKAWGWITTWPVWCVVVQTHPLPWEAWTCSERHTKPQEIRKVWYSLLVLIDEMNKQTGRK